MNSIRNNRVFLLSTDVNCQGIRTAVRNMVSFIIKWLLFYKCHSFLQFYKRRTFLHIYALFGEICWLIIYFTAQVMYYICLFTFLPLSVWDHLCVSFARTKPFTARIYVSYIINKPAQNII